jgi:TonB family protein
VLAPEDESRAMDALRFSLASDIVELVVLTADDPFLQTLREAVGASRRLWHVPSSDKVSDLLVAGGVGILVLDVRALHDTASLFITQIKRQFPDLVIVVAGNRDDENALARLISDGAVYRFIHKPMSPARARLFADAAVKRYDEQRRRAPPTPAAAPKSPRNGALWFGGAFAVICLLLAGIWVLRRTGREQTEPAAAGAPMSAGTAVTDQPSSDAALIARAAQALDANRLTAPPGDHALELYLQAQARNPSDADARAGLAEVHERLLARAENALLEERFDEAAAAIETARKAGVESGRIAFLGAQLAKAREQIKASAELARMKSAQSQGPAADTQADHFAALAMERINQQQLLEPDADNALFYAKEALKADPNANAAQQAEQALALALLSAVRSAIDRRDFARGSSLLDAAAGVASTANIDNLRRSLSGARHEADADAANQLLKSAEQRLTEDRLIEPDNDSAKYYVMTLRTVDPLNPGLQKITQDLGGRLIAKAKGALLLQQYDAARSWLDQAGAIGYSAPESGAILRDLDAATTQPKLSTDIVSASELELVKSVPPVYPTMAEKIAIEGWVELDFTVDESGRVKDVAVHADNPSGVFDRAAISALSQWRYKPVLHDSTPTAQRARIRIRFTLKST